MTRATISLSTKWDVETTGFSRYDRIVEFACLTVVDGVVVEECETLIQPHRDLGPVHVHGVVTPEMLQSVPLASSSLTVTRVSSVVNAQLDRLTKSATDINGIP